MLSKERHPRANRSGDANEFACRSVAGGLTDNVGAPIELENRGDNVGLVVSFLNDGK